MRRFSRQISIPSTLRGSRTMNNNRPLFIASFMTLIAAGFGFAVRGARPRRLGDAVRVYEAGAGMDHGRRSHRLPGDHSLVQHGHRPRRIQAADDHRLFPPRVSPRVITLAATPIYASMGKNATYGLLVLGPVRVFVGQRHVRDGDQSPCRDTLSAGQNPLSQHAARRLAGRIDRGGPFGLLLLRSECFLSTSLGDPRRPVSDSHGHLRHHRPAAEIPRLGSARRRCVVRRRCCWNSLLRFSCRSWS